MRRLLVLLCAIAVLVPVVVVVRLSTGAQGAAAGSVTGGGVISPGIPGPTGGTVNNSVSFGGTVTGVFADSTDDFGQCTGGMLASGTDSTLLGTGSGTFYCNGTGVLGHAISLNNCAVQYNRIGTIEILTGGGCYGTSAPLAGAFHFLPAQTPPNTVTSYSLAGVLSVASAGVPSVTTTTTTISGGPPSTQCTNGIPIIDNTSGPLFTEAIVQVVNLSTVWICVRADASGTGVGGRFIITSGSVTPPSLPGQPSPTLSWVCGSPGNQIPTQHPVASATVDGVFTQVDAYAGTSQVAVCVQAGLVPASAIVPVNIGLPNPTPPSVTFQPDPGTP